MAQTSRIYTPGEMYDLTAPISEATWARNARFATPVEDGFIADPGAACNAIIVSDISGRPLQVSVTTARPLSGGQIPELYNEKLLGSVTLYHGTSSHFALNPSFFIASFETRENGPLGKVYNISGRGLKLMELANRRITLVDGNVTGSVRMLPLGPEDNFGGRFLVDNRSSQEVWMKIVGESSAYKKTEKEIQAQINSRRPDRGGRVIDEAKIIPGAEEFFKPPPVRYYIRATDPTAIRSSSYLQSTLNTNNYVEVASAVATIGQVVVFTADPSGDGGVQACVKEAAAVKFVSSDIVKSY